MLCVLRCVERKYLSVCLARAPEYGMALADVQENGTRRTYTLEHRCDTLCHSSVHDRGSCLYGRYGRYTSWLQVAKVLTLHWAHDSPTAAACAPPCGGVRDLLYRKPGDPSFQRYMLVMRSFSDAWIFFVVSWSIIVSLGCVAVPMSVR